MSGLVASYAPMLATSASSTVSPSAAVGCANSASRRLVNGRPASIAVWTTAISSLASAPEWIEATAAGLAIATGGIADSQSRVATLERWRRAGADILDTRRDGGIELGIGTGGVRVLGVARNAMYPFVWRRVQ